MRKFWDGMTELPAPASSTREEEQAPIPTGDDHLTARSISIDWREDFPIYAAKEFLEQVGDEYGWLGGFDSANVLRCILPFTIIRKAGFRIGRFRVETIPLTPIGVGAEKSFLESTLQHLRSLRVDFVMPGTNHALFRTYPTGAKAAPYGTVVNDLTLTEEKLYNEISQDYRKKIRRAIKAGVEIVTGNEYLAECYEMIADTLRRSGMRFKNRETFEKEIGLGLGNHVKVFVAKQEALTHACLVVPFSRFSGYTWYGGTAAEPQKGAMHLIHWEAMKALKLMGVRQFNFSGVRIRPQAGSKQDGIVTFKTRFGGVLRQGYMWKQGIHPLKFAAYSIAVRLLKGGDTVDLEHKKLMATN